MKVRELIKELGTMPKDADVDIELLGDVIIAGHQGKSVEERNRDGGGVYIGGCRSVYIDNDGIVMISQEPPE